MAKLVAAALLLSSALFGCSSSSDVPPASGEDAGSRDASLDARPLADAPLPGEDAPAPRDGSAPLPDGGATGDAGALRPSPLGGPPVPGSSGCGATSLAVGMHSIALTVDGAARTGLFFVPAGYDSSTAYPIVFVFHGDGGTGAQIRSALDLETPAAGKAVFVYLDGANETWSYVLTGTNADMDFVFAARDSIRGQACIDVGRTFGTGMSRGGFFVNQLACRYGRAEFAAMAPHSGTIEQDDGNAYVYGPPNPNGGPYTENGNYDFMCPVDGTPSQNPPLPALPPPMFIVHGQCDTESGVEFAEGRMTAEHWGFAARCSSTPAVIAEADTGGCAALTSCPAQTADPCYVAPGCSSGHDVTFCAIPEMGHTVWCNAAARIWSFFALH